MRFQSAVRLLPSRSSNKAFISGSTIQSLRDAFRDPTSPFHIPPGSTGPASPDELPTELLLQLEASQRQAQALAGNTITAHQSYSSSDAGSSQGSSPASPPQSQSQSPSQPPSPSPSNPAAQARSKLISLGYDAESLWEQSIVWGHHDAFRHVNNAHYLRFFESGRMQWVIRLGHLLGGQARTDTMLAGKGISLILKSINVNFRRPVTFPDTLLIGHKAIVSSSRTQFVLACAAYSYAQQTIVADSEGVIVWYDYDALKKCDPGDDAWRVLRDVMKSEVREGQGRPSSARQSL